MSWLLLFLSTNKIPRCLAVVWRIKMNQYQKPPGIKFVCHPLLITFVLLLWIKQRCSPFLKFYWVVQFNELKPQAFPVQMGSIVLQCVPGQPWALLPPRQSFPEHLQTGGSQWASSPAALICQTVSLTVFPKPSEDLDCKMAAAPVTWMGQASLLEEDCELWLTRWRSSFELLSSWNANCFSAHWGLRSSEAERTADRTCTCR